MHLNGKRTTPGQDVSIRSRLKIHKGGLEWRIEILELPPQRGPAAEAQLFYLEDDTRRHERE